MKLEPKKTKLLAYSSNSNELLVKLAVSSNMITINNVPVIFTSEAEHVGVVRNTAGNMANIVTRISKHKRALGAMLSAGLARGHRGSPAAALHVHQLYCTPVLMSGLASLVLTRAEVKILDSHYQLTIQNLQRLHKNTPHSIIFFLLGTLSGEAQLHLRQLTLFSMVCHLPEVPLHQHAKYVLTTLTSSSKSWFHQVKDLCRQYNLPHPLVLLDKPVAKESFKKLVKLKVTEYWQGALASECFKLSSLKAFDPLRASLQKPHPIWTSSAGNSFECCKSTILARMVSGRYRTEMLCRFWSTNKSGYCLSDTCHQVVGDLEHLLAVCPALEQVRNRLHSLWCLKTVDCPPLHRVILRILGSNPITQVKFLLDSVSFPEVIHLTQTLGQELLDRVMYLTRTWVFAVHRQKLKLLGRWPEGVQSKNTTAHFFLDTNQQTDNNDIPAIIPITTLTNIVPITGSTTLPTTTQDGDMSLAAPVAETAQHHHHDKPSEPGPTYHTSGMPSANIDVLEQCQLGGQVVSFLSFLHSYLQASQHKLISNYQCTAPT